MNQSAKYIFLSWHDPEYSRSGVKYYGMKLAKLDAEFVKVPTKFLEAIKFLYDLKRILIQDCIFIVASPCHLLVMPAKIVRLKFVVLDAGWPLSDSTKIRHISSGYLERLIFNLKSKIVDFLSLTLADLVFFESHQQVIRKKFITGKKNYKYQVNFTGFNETRVSKSKVSNRISREVKGIVNQRYALFRGSYNAEANIEQIIEAFQKVKDSGIILVIVTKKIPEDLLKQRNIQFILGERTEGELNLLFKKSKFILGQFGKLERTEFTIPHKFFESAYYGKAYVTPRTKALAEVLPDDAGIYLEENTSEELAEVIKSICKKGSKLKKIESNAKKNYSVNLSQQRITADFIFKLTWWLNEVKKNKHH